MGYEEGKDTQSPATGSGMVIGTHHQEACYKCGISGFPEDLVHQNLNKKKIP